MFRWRKSAKATRCARFGKNTRRPGVWRGTLSSRIRVGTAPVSWGVIEVEGWGGNRPYSAVLDEMVEAGYTGTELGPHGFLPAEPKALTRELQARGLELVAAFVPLPL